MDEKEAKPTLPPLNSFHRSASQQMLSHHIQQAERTLAEGERSSGAPGAGENEALLSTKKIQDLMASIDPREKLDSVVEEVLAQIADEFVHSVAACACQLARHRNSENLEVADVQLHLEKNWNIRVPGFSSQEVASRTATRRIASESHQARLAVLRKALSAAPTRPSAASRKRKSR